MTNTDILYRAYRELRESMSHATSYTDFTAALSRADNHSDIHNGSIVIREIEMDWVEEIEKAIPFLDGAIREQRRFIVQQEEIVPIEKSRKITSESVRHLAQHTNMIASVEGDRVTPQSILNIYREESFAIYENRFLYTLVKNACMFIEKRYQSLIAVPGESKAYLELQRDICARQEKIGIKLQYSTEYQEETTVDIAADVSTLSNFQRVMRIRKIFSDFLTSPLMRELVGCEPVRPPITRTNLLMKNPNFHGALDLWVFLESYTKIGYYTVMNESSGSIAPAMQESLYDAINLVRFVVRMNLNESFRDKLEEEYQKEIRRREYAAKKAEDARVAEEQRRLRLALEDQANTYEKKYGELKAAQEKQIQEIRTRVASRISKMEADYREKTIAVEQDCQNRIKQQAEAHQAEVQRIVSEAEEKLRTVSADFEAQIANNESIYEAEKTRMTEAFDREISCQKAISQTALSKQQEDYESRLQEQETKHSAQSAAMVAEHAETIHQLEETHRRGMEDFQQQHEAMLQSTKAEYAQILDEKEKRYLAEKNRFEKKDMQQQKELLDVREALRDRDAKLTEQRTANREHVSSMERELRSLRKELGDTQRKLKNVKRTLEKSEISNEHKLAQTEHKYSVKLKRLDAKLQKALKKCPYQEVMAAGEELAAETAE